MKYTIYFHDMIEEYNEIGDNDRETGNVLLEPDQYERLPNPNLKIRFWEHAKRINEKTAKDLHFECWLDYEAENDTEAITKVDDVLKENGFEWVDVFFIFEMEPLSREVYKRNIK